jgi:hypothetical protein
MGHAIPAQAPVVLRSRFNKLRALLAIALICVAGLIVAVVSVAGDSDEVAGKPVQSINYAGSSNVHPSTGSSYVNPSTGYPSEDLRRQVPRTGYDGGPVERYEAETKYFIGPVGR